MGKLIIFAPVWNDMDWIDAMIKQIEYWSPNQLYFCEGCWDPKFSARSNDGTREYVDTYIKDKLNTYVVDNLRKDSYRENQANTIKMVMRLAEIESGDWVMYQSCDFYLFKKDIDLYKKYIRDNAFDYPRFEIRNFWDTIKLYWPKMTNQSVNLPWRFVTGAYWIPTCHLCVKGKQYHESPHVRQKTIVIKGYHYEGFRMSCRLKDKYAVGDRQSPVIWKNGVKIKKRRIYDGLHPEFVRETLNKKNEWNAGNY
jgi:glutaredoxin